MIKSYLVPNSGVTDIFYSFDILYFANILYLNPPSFSMHDFMDNRNLYWVERSVLGRTLDWVANVDVESL